MSKTESSPVAFEYLTPNEWLARNLPDSVDQAHQAAVKSLHEHSAVVDVSPLLAYLQEVTIQYEYEANPDINAYPLIDEFFRTKNADSKTEDEVWEEVRLKEQVMQIFDVALSALYTILRYERLSLENFGLAPLGLTYYQDGRVKGWTTEEADLDNGLGQLVLVENWDVNHPDQGVQFTLQLSSYRKNTVYWTSEWVTESEIPEVLAEVLPYMTDNETFMILYHLHHGQVEF